MNRISTVEKVVVNSVMAGCLPEYIPVVIAIQNTFRFSPDNIRNTWRASDIVRKGYSVTLEGI